MGKYKIKPTIKEDNSNGMLLAKCLNTIANELAEANRLKRLELQQKLSNKPSALRHYPLLMTDEQLEDKA
jgi:hypothetical protein